MEYIKILLANPVVGGIIGGSAVVSVFWALFKQLPMKIYSFVLKYFTVSIIVEENDPSERFVFNHVQFWLHANIPKKRLLNLRIIGTHSNGEGHYTPTPGSLFFKYNNRWFFITKTREIKQSGTPQESIQISTYGKNTKILKDLIEEMIPKKEESPLNRYVSINAGIASEGLWRLLRPLDTIILQEKQKERIINTIQSFVNSESWYKERALIYQTGFLFYGEPGTGKTSLAMALAGAVNDYNINVFSLGSFAKESDFISSWCRRGLEKQICIFEDVDTIAGTMSRENNDHLDSNLTSSGDGKPIGLGTLLGVLDGTIGYREGTIIILTTNFADRLDKALIRHGRIDHHEHIGLFDYDEVLKMCELFFKDESKAKEFAKTVSLPISPAQLQSDLAQELKIRLFSGKEQVTVKASDVIKHKEIFEPNTKVTYNIPTQELT